MNNKQFTPVDLDCSKSEQDYSKSFRDITHIEPDSKKLSLAEIIEGYKNGVFNNIKVPVFRKETYKDKYSVAIEKKFYQYINIRVEDIEYQ